MNRITRRTLLHVAGTGLGVAGMGMSGFGLRPSRAADKALDKATVTLDWHVSGYHAPFFIGLDQGIFQKHGIDLTVNPGNGSKNTILAVAAGNSTFGFADASVLPAAALQGAEVKMFCSYMATTPFGVMFKKDAGITKPKDLEGKAYGDFPASATYALFPVFAKHAGLDPAKVQVVNISPAAQASALLDGQFAATFTALNDSFVTLKHKGADLGSFAYADYGFNLPSMGLSANTETLKNTDLVKRFTKAWLESVAAAKADPAKAAAATKQANAQAPDIDVQMDMMADTFSKRLTNKRTRGKPAGWMDEADWTDLVNVLAEAGTIKDKPAVATLFTNAYLPT
jgi:NitT/TauT family transport system substrate-binding protein